jgi:hypothetical protein
MLSRSKSVSTLTIGWSSARNLRYIARNPAAQRITSSFCVHPAQDPVETIVIDNPFRALGNASADIVFIAFLSS